MGRGAYDAAAVEAKWIQKWADARLHEGDRPEDTSKPKFFIHFAYPGISGFLHVGHMRGFTYSDVFARYARMTGHQVLFPAGFHASGIPSVGLAKKVERGDAATLEYLRNNGCPEDVIPTLADPMKVVEYFSGVYTEEYWKRFGFLIDWRRLCTTIDPGYQRFIQWQFRRLNDLGLLVQKPHYGPFCPVDGAVAVDASETDISQGGDAEVKEYTNVLFEGPEGWLLPCATLRPETVYGVTNLWVDPAGDYVRIQVGNSWWVVGAAAAEKIREQRDDVTGDPEPVETKSLFASVAKNPVTGEEVPVLEAPFVDPARGTGVVMSVPAHAPFDFQALKDLGMPVEPRVIIDLPGVDGVPAEAACARHGVASQADQEALDAATDEVYKDEFHKGRMNDACGELAGRAVRDAKDAIVEVLSGAGYGGKTYEFNQPVVCRCGQDVVIRRIPDQWFIKYSDQELTRRSKEHAKGMRIFPPEYERDMPSVLDWFSDRACIRRGSWLGTPFPYDEDWIIEPISDSTFYSAYYVVSHRVAAGQLGPGDLTDAFFDHVFLGQGKAKNDAWAEARRDFEYWYPVDINLGGKEHKTVHFPVYLMNHVALGGKDLAPRGIFVNWWVTQKAGEKISKSKGGAEPIPGAAAKYSVDAMRLYYCNVASAHVDFEWDPAVPLNHKNRIERIHRLVTGLATEGSAEATGMDAWLVHAWNARVEKARQAFEAFDLREATTQLFFEFYRDVQWWRRRGGRMSAATRDVLRAWAAAMTPVTPFVGEELWETLGGDGLATATGFPGPLDEAADEDVLGREDYLRGVLDDLLQIKRVSGIEPKEVTIHTSPAWKLEVEQMVAERVAAGDRDVGAMIKEALAREDAKANAKHVPAFVQRALKQALAHGGSIDRSGIDEEAVLSESAEFLGRELGGAVVRVHSGDDDQAPDPGKKRAVAAPGKPGLHLA